MFLDIDLTTKSVKKIPISQEMRKLYLGGRGLASRILYEALPSNTHPLSPENVLVIANGYLVGTSVAAANVTFGATLSPLTGILGDAKIAGFFGIRLKAHGYDGLILRGACKSLTSIHIHKNHVDFRDANHLKELKVSETDKALKETPEDTTLVIGPAGENLIPFACIISDSSHAFGRTGLGAVLGSKKVKGIVISYKIPYVPYSNKSLLVSKKLLGEPYSLLRAYGSAGFFPVNQKLDRLVAYNRKSTTFPFLDLSPLLEAKKGGQSLCFNCPIGCKVKKRAEDSVAGIHYESLSAMGPLVGCQDLRDILLSASIADELGMDVITLGNLIALAIECSENGLIKESLEWGDGEKIRAFMHKILKREGEGKIFSQGVKEAASLIGEEAEDFIVETYGLDWGGVEARPMKAAALLHMTSTRGGDCTKGLGERNLLMGDCEDPEFYKGKGKLVMEQENIAALVDALGICRFPILLGAGDEHYNLLDIQEQLNEITGKDFPKEELIKIGERIFNLERLFNLRMGVDHRNSLSKRLQEPILDGIFKGHRLHKKELLEELGVYYNLRHWDYKGIPREEKLKELEIDGRNLYKTT